MLIFYCWLAIPPAVAAFWVGHSIAVSERYYMRYASGLHKGKNVEEAMGLSELLQQAIAGYNG